MYTLNFKKQFTLAIESGEKRQTIRALRKDGRSPQPGDTLRFYTGMRTKECRHLLDAMCIAVSPVHISREGLSYTLMVNGQKLSLCEGIDLAKADGFKSRSEFLEFFIKHHGLPFDGLLIQWAQSPQKLNVGDKVVILKHKRTSPNVSYADRTGVISRLHFAGVYVLLTRSKRETTDKNILFLTKDGTDEICVLN